MQAAALRSPIRRDRDRKGTVTGITSVGLRSEKDELDQRDPQSTICIRLNQNYDGEA